MTARLTYTNWRRSLALLTTILVAAFAISIALTTATASAETSVSATACLACGAPVGATIRASDRPYYIGYATVDSRPDCALNTTGIRCMIAVTRSVPAYSWDPYTGWKLGERLNPTRVWVYPFGSGWSWTWTQDTGWMAVRSAQIIIRYPVATPVCNYYCSVPLA